LRSGGVDRVIWEYEFFKLLKEDKRLAWDYATALRGCDISCSEILGSIGTYSIKLFYTAPLRSDLCNVLNQHDTFSRCKDLKTEKDLINLIKNLKGEVGRSSHHYLFHAMKGYNALGQYEIGNAIQSTGWNDDDNTKYVWEVIWRVNNYVRKSWKEGGFET